MTYIMPMVTSRRHTLQGHAGEAFFYFGANSKKENDMKRKTGLMFLSMCMTFTFLTGVTIAFAQDATVPPGVEKKGEVPGKGSHKGWEKGKHKGWAKESEGTADLKKHKQKAASTLEKEKKGAAAMTNEEAGNLGDTAKKSAKKNKLEEKSTANAFGKGKTK